MGGFDTVIFEKTGPIAYVTLNRPKALNAYNIRMRDELYEILGAIRDDPDVAVAVFKASGANAFCAGADLSEFLTAPSPLAARKVRWERDIWGLFLSIPQPLIAALHGYVLGSGLEIALCCDFRIAAQDAQFGLPEVGLGMIPAAGGTQTLPRTVGRSKALEMLLTGRRINAEEAFHMGLLNSVVPKDKLLESAQNLATVIASFDPLTVRCAKKAVTRGGELTLRDGLDLEIRLVDQLRTSNFNNLKKD
jgi:enoyl-CoA hydratase/carnithine racemase